MNNQSPERDPRSYIGTSLDGSIAEVALSEFNLVDVGQTTRELIHTGSIDEDIVLSYNNGLYSRKSKSDIPHFQPKSFIFENLPGGEESYIIVENLVRTGIVVEYSFWARIS